MRKIIAILGLPGSGKTEVINYIMTKYKLPKVYFGQVTFDEMARRGLPINEQNERLVREDLRAKFGLLHYAEQVIAKIKSLPHAGNVLVESLYSWDEYLRFKEEFGDNFTTVAVYAPPKLRYERLRHRIKRSLTSSEAQSRDYAQIVNLKQAGPIAMADYTIVNTGTLPELHAQTEKILNSLA